MARLLSRGDERIALTVAVVAHVALLAALVLAPARKAPPTPQRMAVTLADDVGPVSTSPHPEQPAAEDLAPTLGETTPPPQPAPEPQPQPKPQPVPQPQPRPAPVPIGS